MAWPTTFANLAGGNQPLSIFDVMFQQVANMIAIPCAASGQNTITLTAIGTAPIITSYTFGNFLRFKAAQTSNGPVSAQFGTLGFVNVYKADGLTQASSGDIVQGQEYVLISDPTLNSNAGGWFLENAAVPTAIPTAGGMVAGLSIANNGGTPNTQLDVALTEVVVNNASGGALRFTSSASPTFTINLGTTGVNGLDTGAIVANQNYYIWAISNGGLLRGLASLQSTFTGLSANFPSGYSFAKLLGIWRTASGSAQLMGGQQNGTRFSYRPGVAQGVPAVLATGTAAFWTALTTTGQVPTALVKNTNFVLQKPPSSSVAASGFFAAIAPNNSYSTSGAAATSPPIMIDFPFTTGGGFGNSGPATVLGSINGPGPFVWGATAGVNVIVEGWDVNL